MTPAAVWGDYIRRLRRRMGVSQDEFSRRARVTPKTVYRWEKGQGRPHWLAIDRIGELARGMGFEPPPSPFGDQLPLLPIDRVSEPQR
ncbi:MAG: helix-turn-helix transcriptional regulator [Armatimonadetes bacterium]|nr:helix-turn-helix transcriptional regulator [Armatimonadota bacterium]